MCFCRCHSLVKTCVFCHIGPCVCSCGDVYGDCYRVYVNMVFIPTLVLKFLVCAIVLGEVVSLSSVVVNVATWKLSQLHVLHEARLLS